ncbi:aladin-like [Sipha flava]|uniref:Aladin n=1 Tax=Sipha flava TaxID=143950 RepID=A0A2S2Q291_9HEMI|nr:aladin-like [Sipha flava]
MCSLRDFPELRDQSLTDKNASMNIVIKRVKPEAINYPKIVVQLLVDQNPGTLFLPTSGLNTLQKVINKCAEEGFWTAYEEFTHYIKNNSNNISIIVYPLKFILKFSPRANLKGPENLILPDISRTKLWSSSVIRCMSWHPQTVKLAVVSSHDIIYVYNRKGSEARIKNKSQYAILSLAWRPFSVGTLAVGCEKGIFIWTIEFSNIHIRPAVNNKCKLVRDNHRYITGLSWNKMGDLLISSAVTSKTMYVWNYAFEECVPLHRINSDTLNFVHWSPDNTKVFSCSTNETFRIWSTDKWTADRWSLNNRSRVQCACWSPCSSVLLFATNSSPIINAIDFRKSDVFNGSTNYKKVAWPVIDLKSECVNDKVIGGIPLDMCWDQHGKRLAITFKNSSALVVFQTTISVAVVDCIPFCIIQGRLDEEPSTIAFQPTYEEGSLLTIGWSNGNIEYVPFTYSCKSVHEPELSEANISNTSKNISGRASLAASNSLIEYLLN